MYKKVTLNSEISKVLSDLGHGDSIVIGDCGLPVPAGVKKIDISLKQGVPSFKDTYEVIKESMHIERQIYAEEVKEKALLHTLENDIPAEKVTHEEFKELTKGAKAVIRTGETTPYANVILVSNVFF
ncbi:D-ribose pyranase [Corticicoccus populi]|uniref:D-ribose pyranase n=1 Tax=Corticicoccus populi TaxID=1812821 RepID=A0ABW5X167_9STAP